MLKKDCQSIHSFPLKEVKDAIATFDQITKIFEPESGAETYLKLTPEIEEKFSQNLITFEQESFDKIKVDQELIDQIDDVLIEYRQSENTLVSELSDLISDKELNQVFEAKIAKVRENYERYVDKDDRISYDR